jgi:hypothetical protein
MIEEEKLIAFVDGEASESEQAEIEAAASTDPRLAARIEAHRRLRAQLARAYAPIAEQPSPTLLVDLAERRAAGVVNFAARARRSFAVQAAALAACLIGGVFLGLFAAGEGRPVVADPQGLRAGGALSRFLDTRLASEAEPTDTMRVGVSFRNREGDYCRMFELPRLGGLACKTGRVWRIQVAERVQSRRSAYRMAGAEGPGALAAMNAIIQGEPLDAAQERAARTRGWRAD